MINKENILSYAKLVNKVISDDSYKLTDDDNRILNYMKELIKNNPKYADFAEKIIDMNGNIDQIQQLLDDYTKENTNENKSEEEQIAETFNISVNDIEHLYLNGGKKIFHFYSNDLGRDVILENTKDGKNLSEILEDLKRQNNQDTNNLEKTDSTDLLMDNSRVSNLEMKMYSPEQIINNKNIVQLISDKDLFLVKYLVSNAERLNIKLINLENLFYITNDHKIKEITFDKNFRPVVSDPDYEHNLDDKQTDDSMSENLESINDEEMSNDSDLNDMFDDTEKEEQEKSEEEKKEQEKESKGKVLKLENPDSNGFANNYFFIFSVILIIIIFVVIVFIMR